jgi:hypothetical protein
MQSSCRQIGGPTPLAAIHSRTSNSCGHCSTSALDSGPGGFPMPSFGMDCDRSARSRNNWLNQTVGVNHNPSSCHYDEQRPQSATNCSITDNRMGPGRRPATLRCGRVRWLPGLTGRASRPHDAACRVAIGQSLRRQVRHVEAGLKHVSCYRAIVKRRSQNAPSAKPMPAAIKAAPSGRF